MRVAWACAVVLAAMFAGGPLQAQGFSDWRDGDLVFQDTGSGQGAAIQAATGSRYTHVGIVKVSGGAPVVVEAAGPVGEVSLEAFLDRGVGGSYAVYRLRGGLAPDTAAAMFAAARGYYGRPYDIFFRMGTDAIYCSELPFHAFRQAGIELGQAERFGDLALERPAARALFLARWRDHPDCRKAGMDENGCWIFLKRQAIITPLRLSRDARLEKLFSTLD